MSGNRNVLVLGSKPDSKLPDIDVDMIYSANGAAERALFYKQLYPNTPHTALIAAKEFMENEQVKMRVIKSKPNKLIVRSGTIQVPEELTNYSCEIVYFNQKEQFNFQSRFYKLGWLDIVLGEMIYEDNFLEILKHLYKCIKYRGFLGVSTGFFSILLAAMENPNSNILSSGIGLAEGSHYYTLKESYGFLSKKTKDKLDQKKIILKNKFRNTSRKRVERFLIKRIKNVYKNMIISMDKSFVDNSDVKLWKGKVF